MSFPCSLDFDRILYEALSGLETALNEWTAGAPVTEEPFMNRLTAEFTRRRRRCDVGTTVPIMMTSRVAFLHRQGDRQSDAFGSDLAMTVEIEQSNFRKTALFQIKVSDGFQVRLERSQLQHALQHPATAPRAFVLVADKERKRTRTISAGDALNLFETDADTATRECSGWSTLGQWLNGWLCCEIGEESRPNEPNQVEPLLERFIVEPPEDWEAPWGSAPDPLDYPSGLRPAKAWLEMFFRPGAEQEKRLR